MSNRPNSLYGEKLVEHTIRVWQPYYTKRLTRADAIEIINNGREFIRFLLAGDADEEGQHDSENF